MIEEAMSLTASQKDKGKLNMYFRNSMAKLFDNYRKKEVENKVNDIYVKMNTMNNVFTGGLLSH